VGKRYVIYAGGHFPCKRKSIHSLCLTNFAYAIVEKCAWEVSIFSKVFERSAYSQKYFITIICAKFEVK